MMKFIILKTVSIAMVALLLLPFKAEAGLIDRGSFTTDTISGLDWLDFSATNNLSTNYVSDQFKVGGLYDGWRFARYNEVTMLFDNAGATGPYNGTYSSNSFNGAASRLINLMGATRPPNSFQNIATVHFSGDLAPELGGFMIREWFSDPAFDILDIRQFMFATGNVEIGKAHALVRLSVASVPEPATLMLFVIALVGMLGLTRRVPLPDQERIGSR